jgi:hypothetical protein
MGVDISTDVYLPNYNLWARPVTFYPINSRPGVASFAARGIFGTVPIDIITTDASNISDQRTILDILEREFTVIPMQQDRVYIGVDPGGMPEAGMFEINDVMTNGGGETTLDLRRVVTANP